MAFSRLRRLRNTELLRKLIRPTRVSVDDLIMPYFVIAGQNRKEPIVSMPGVNRLSIDNLIKDIKELRNLGVTAILLFGLAQEKDEQGSEASSPKGIVHRAVRAIKREIKDIIVITDVCLCGYTNHGHCGILRSTFKAKRSTTFKIDNDTTIKILAKIALLHAQAGADLVAPSAMMDGQVAAIRQKLDKAGYQETGILAYSAKFASHFYGPFREALDSSPQFGDRKSYQLDFANSRDALRKIEEDLKEGADIVMVKPALGYLDIIWRAKEKFNVPVAAYNVSGEYSMIKQAAKAGLINEKEMVMEILTAIKRAGADLVITYHAKEVAKWLKV